AVRYRAGHRCDSPQLSAGARQFLSRDSEPVSFVAHYGLQVYRAANGGVERSMRALEQEPVVSFVAPIFRRPGYENDPVLTTTRFLVEFNRGVTEQQVADLNRTYNVEIVERLAYAAPALGYLLEAPRATEESGPIALSRVYFETGLVRYAEPELIQRR